MVEKGLSLPSPRPGFGEDAVRKLCGLVLESIEANQNAYETSLAVNALESYRQFNDQHGVTVPTHVTGLLHRAASLGVHPSAPAIKHMQARTTPPSSSLEFLTSRSSVRNFSHEGVPDEVLAAAARAAQSAPCVCNRQAGRIHFVKDEKARSRVLALQNGNRGFGATAPVIAVISIDLSEFLEANERYQCWIDGGMFAQNFLLGIHAQGYGACPLNWSAPVARDRAFHRLGIVPDNEQVLMLVALGALKKSYRVAASQRRSLETVATWSSQSELE